MKILLTICLLLATTFTVRAQKLSFEETVKYINDKIVCCSENNFDTIIAKRNGTIKWLNKSVNLFDLMSIEATENTILHKDGISLYKGISTVCVYFKVSVSDDDEVLNRFKIKANGERVYNALQHLRSLCTKEKDPFDK